jgi:4-amino-4-deoxy-L-arabinose transferase-like glycosyltransferase
MASEQPDRVSTYFFIVIVVMYIVLRVAFYQGIVPSDPVGYLQYAKQIAEGEFQLELHHYNTRFGITLPIAFLFMVFGINEATTVMWPFVCSVVTLYLTFRIGTALVGTVAALLACTFLTVLPLDIGLAMQVLPEPIMTAMLCICVWCFYRGIYETNVFKARLWLLGAGMALWGAYSAKITGIFLMPALIGYTIIFGRPLRNLGWLFLDCSRCSFLNTRIIMRRLMISFSPFMPLMRRT